MGLHTRTIPRLLVGLAGLLFILVGPDFFLSQNMEPNIVLGCRFQMVLSCPTGDP